MRPRVVYGVLQEIKSSVHSSFKRGFHMFTSHSNSGHANPSSFLALVSIGSIFLAGCQGTMHSRWAQEKDSDYYWSGAMQNVPINVHGTVPGTDGANTLARIEDGTTDDRYARSHDGTALRSAQRIELYVGGTELPVNATYCSVAPTMRTVNSPPEQVMMGAALCDGPRLVVTTREPFAPEALTSSTLPGAIKAIKARLMLAVSNSRAHKDVAERYED